MRISLDNSNIHSNKQYGLSLQNGFKISNKKQPVNKSHSQNIREIPCSSENLQANFCPSFGSIRKVAEVYLKDKNTGENVKASIMKVSSKDYISSYTVMHKNTKVGSMLMSDGDVFPEDIYVLQEADNVIPKVYYLKSFLGEKYEGVGIALINAAVNQSKQLGEKGYLWLESRIIDNEFINRLYNRENPIPFFYKLGFKAIDENTDKYIKLCLENSQYDMLPKSATLLLTPEAIEANKKYFPYVKS